uniref:Uncharacterized protein n=1 Tax=Cacopsylla melanoneura TaxID=428564 RepID=A0A8D8QX53_9HEMI
MRGSILKNWKSKVKQMCSLGEKKKHCFVDDTQAEQSKVKQMCLLGEKKKHCFVDDTQAKHLSGIQNVVSCDQKSVIIIMYRYPFCPTHSAYFVTCPFLCGRHLGEFFQIRPKKKKIIELWKK